ncbi:MAG: amino acid ABC transporter substrate-binding protein [Nitriliruptorales bacterium]|nr:amino acid ABC transporter substrate-binding protein [Nitriliruptorales bacterium]
MRTRKWIKLSAIVLAIGLLASACSSDDGPDEDETATEGGTDTGQEGEASGDTLQTVTDRGTLVCGVNGAVPGFSFADEEGNITGFDADYCRAVAAAVLGDPDAVEFRQLTAEQRFTALQGGEIDVLIRNTTWTATRDGSEGATFATTTFYDGQGLMVKADSGVSELADLQGATVCVLSGTTTELNLTTLSEAEGLNLTPQTFEDNETLQSAFEQGQCQAWTSDKSQLAAVKSNFPEEQGGPDGLVILEDTISKEPLGPVTRDGDSQWSQIVDWVVIATIQAEEFGINQGNVEGFSSDSPDVQRFLGQSEGEAFDPGLGFPSTTWTTDVISAVGNYGEIYNRHVGPDTPLGLERGLNNLWTEGGLLYAPPYR